MSEQGPVATPDATIQTSVEKPTAPRAKKITPTLNDDQRRLARNAALREWRKKNADRVKKYMAEWRAKRVGSDPTSPSPKQGQPAVAVKRQKSPRHPAAKRPTLKAKEPTPKAKKPTRTRRP